MAKSPFSQAVLGIACMANSLQIQFSTSGSSIVRQDKVLVTSDVLAEMKGSMLSGDRIHLSLPEENGKAFQQVVQTIAKDKT